ncbi:phytanoyl-CoA dioxygenase family protein [Virgisporangium aurantiacum]|uniref:Phytanoyl-CoA dioxygenase n=1 Tax=Virgisporangium aurantiacum TaxID=175570 RepID=A0A8J3Z9A0_9ACTN|nr:phytanoyl-CoA dioxygenase family protein [Virgisporangium aurantiacum]GIJ57290.1 phytanoyl-CoA dioxygenase [Virgisporangium aurantiacum]
MLSAGQRETFHRSGLLTVESAVPPAAISAMRDRFWEFLAREHSIDQDRVDTWVVERPRGLQALRRSGAFNLMASRQVCDALDDLLGVAGWQPPSTWGLPLVTFPVPGARWTVPSTGWHVDSYGPEHDLPGVTVFVFLTTVAERGGGTVVLSGSHRLFNRHIASTGTWRPAVVKAALASRHPWLRTVWSEDRQVAPTTIGSGTMLDGAHVQVQELTGHAGDVVLMHPRTLHTSAPNGLPTPRMMLVEIVHRADPPANVENAHSDALSSAVESFWRPEHRL